MIWKGEPLPIIYFYQNGKLVWDYILPEGFKSLEEMRQYIIKLLVGE